MSGAASASNMWPMLLDYSRDESKRILRRLELEAYSSLMSAFRAQGDLSKDKKNILQELQNVLSISLERHRAEVRRAVNDERLTTIANNMAGPNVNAEWQIEGRRLIPLMPRLVPQTAFTVTANNYATMQAEKNLSMPSPSKTGVKTPPASSTSPASTTTKVARPNSPSSNVVVLPSGMSIHIKGGLNTEEEDNPDKKRRRSTSIERVVTSRSSTMATSLTGTTGNTKLTYTTSSGNTIHGISPMKIIFTKSPAKSHNTITPSQKVILVSNASQTTAPSILHKSVSGPIVVKGNSTSTTTTTTSLTHTKPSVILPCTSAGSSSVNPASAINSHAQSFNRSTTGNVSVSASSALMPSTMQLSKPRPKTITHTKTTVIGQNRPGIVIPVGRQAVHGSPQTMQGVQIKPVTSKPTIHIKQEGSMKIITQGIPTNKILPSQTGGSPIVVVTTCASTSVAMVKSGSTISGSHIAGKVLNISTHGGKVIASSGGRPIITGRPTTANVVTVNPKTLQLTAVKTVTGTPVTTARLATQAGVKPNVIVVQKAHGKHPQTGTGATTIHVSKTSAASSSPFEKELVSFIQKQDSNKQVITTQLRPSDRKHLIQKGIIDPKKPQQIQIVRQRSEPSTSGRSSLLAELIQAAGIMPESSSGSTSGQESPVTQEESPVIHMEIPTMSSKADTVPVNQWVEYDVTEDVSAPYTVASEPTDSSAIKALLDLQNISSLNKPAVTALPVTSSKSVHLDQLTHQLHTAASNLYAIEQGDVITSEQKVEQLGDDSDDVQFIHEETVQMQLKNPHVDNAQIYDDNIEVQEVSDVVVTSDPASSSLAQDIIELDPQTGMLITSAAQMPCGIQSQQQFSNSPITSVTRSADGRLQVKNRTLVLQNVSGTASVPLETPGGGGDKSLDIFSSAIAEAQLDLDSYQFIAEDSVLARPGAAAQDNVTATQQDNVTLTVHDVSDDSVSLQDDGAETQSHTTSAPVAVSALTDGEITTPGGAVSALTEEVITTPGGTTTDFSLAANPVVQSEVQAQKRSIVNTSVLRNVNVPTSSHTVVMAASNPGHRIRQPQVLVTRCSNVAVTVEASGLDLGHMTMDDFTSQRLQERTEYNADEQADDLQAVSSPGGSGSDVDSNALRLSKRKRKPPPAADDSPPHSGMAGWIRAALGLLHRVSRFRGANKEKGDINAASWFTRPVNADEAPDYYKLIQKPMDFGTVKKKLENGQYRDWNDFEDDMTLIRDNCHSYNPPGHEVRRDCDEVFSFFKLEFDKIQDKWQKTHSYSPAKKIKFDKSPTKS